jgi:hypothetical protein
MASSPIGGVSRDSAGRSFRVVWGLWTGMGLIYAGGYLHVAVLSGRLLEGRLLAVLPLLQAILIPAYVWRKQFATQVEAMIRSAAGAMAIAGLTECTFLLYAGRYGNFRSSWGSDRLQLGYVVTILLLSGAIGGAALGMLRWRFSEARPERVLAQPRDSWWRHYLHSAALWVASMTTVGWGLGVWFWAGSDTNSNAYLYYVIVLGVWGLFFVAPIPVVWPPRAGASRLRQIFKYSVLACSSVWMLPVLYGTLIWKNLLAGVLLTFTSFGILYLFIPCFFWAILYSYAGFPSEAASSSRKQPDSSHTPREDRGISKIVWFFPLAQMAAFLAGLLAASPASLGFHGVGCLTVSSARPFEYWFWDGYKGFSSVVRTKTQIIFRPAVDSSVCLTQGVSDPDQIELGYVSAARAWFWLIDPEQWENERTRQIRKELARFLGRDFSSYEELQAWWEQNSEYLVLSGKDRLLEVHKPDIWDFASWHSYNQQHPGSVPSAVETLRQEAHLWLSGPDPEPYPGAADLEARLRGLNLFLADSIEVLTGERQRRAIEFLHNLTGTYFATKVGWGNYLDQISNTNPWRMSRFVGQTTAAAILAHTYRPGYEADFVLDLRKRTGQNYATLGDFVPWLENPENTRRDEWDRANILVDDLCIDEGDTSFRCPRRTMASLRALTGKTFISPEMWVQWWRENRSNLVLSDDGRMLVAKGK